MVDLAGISAQALAVPGVAAVFCFQIDRDNAWVEDAVPRDFGP